MMNADSNNSKKETESPNMEWKKSGFDSTERVTLKTNVRKANEAEKKSKNAPARDFRTPTISGNGIKKLRKKIRQAGDEEDEDENEYQIAPDELTMQNSLYAALKPSEKQFLKQKQNLDTMQSQGFVKKASQLTQANKMVKAMGLKGLKAKTISRLLTDESKNNVIELSLTEKGVKAKDLDKLSPKKIEQLVKGAEKIKLVAEDEKIVKDMSITEIVEASEKQEKEIAAMICEKRGVKKGFTKKEMKQVPNKISAKQMEELIKKDRKSR